MRHQSQTSRDRALDILRGLCAISIVMIHTTFWSGSSYVPQIIQSLSLLVDVPAFFFIAGASFAYSKHLNPIGILWKMILYFGIAIALYDSISWIITGECSYMATLSALSLRGFETPALPILGGSYWFVPMLCAASIAGAIILRFIPIPYWLVGGIALAIYAYIYCKNTILPGAFLGAGMQYLVFYTALFVLGYHFIQSHKQKLFIVALALVGGGGFLLLVALYKLGFPANTPSLFDLQSHKFPVALPYVLASCFSLAFLLWFYRYMALTINGGELSLYSTPYELFTKYKQSQRKQLRAFIKYNT